MPMTGFCSRTKSPASPRQTAKYAEAQDWSSLASDSAKLRNVSWRASASETTSNLTCVSVRSRGTVISSAISASVNVAPLAEAMR